MKLIKILYYKYYRFQVRLGNADIAPFSSLLIIAFTIMLYYFDFFILLSVAFPKLAPNLSWKFNSLLLLFLITLLYFSLMYKGKYKMIIKEQEKNISKKAKWFSILFPILAFIIFNVGFILKILQNQP